MNLPLNGSQIHSLEYQRGERDDRLVYRQAQPITISSDNFIEPVQKAIDNIHDAELYAGQFRTWLGWGTPVTAPCPENLLPNLPYSRDRPFDGKIWSRQRWWGYKDLQDEGYEQERLLRIQGLDLKLGLKYEADGHHFTIRDNLEVDTDVCRGLEWYERVSNLKMLGRPTSTIVSFVLAEVADRLEVTSVKVDVVAPDGIEDMESYAEAIFKKTLFVPLDIKDDPTH